VSNNLAERGGGVREKRIGGKEEDVGEKGRKGRE
jgi:hypothetical protein